MAADTPDPTAAELLAADLVAALDGELIVRLTREMIAIPTENPPGRERACAHFIHETLRGWGIESELVHAPDPERPQVVAWHRGSGTGPTLILNGHMDTVPAGDPAAWRHPPFEATLEDGRLYGLGAADMKGALAVAMAVMKALHDSRARLSGTVMFQAAIGEEMDEPGTRTLLREGYVGDYAIMLEPTDLQIGPATRGACWHAIDITAPSVHCGLAPGEMSDAADVLREFSVRLARYHAEVAQRRHALLAPPACRITKAELGTAHNSTAGRCTLMVDRRMLPDESFESVTRELQDILDAAVRAHPGTEAALRYLDGNEPTQTPLDNPLIAALKQGHLDVCGSEPAVWGPPYGSDMRNFVFDAGIPATNFGAGDFRVCHQPDEFVPVEDLLTCAKAVAAATVRLIA